MFISIICPFRDRDLGRVKKSILSLINSPFFSKDIEIIFVDYGSDIYYSQPVVDWLTSIDIQNIRYLYSHTIGMPWNKSVAINIAVRNSEADYIYVSDIDMVYGSEFLPVLRENCLKGQITFFQVGYLQKNDNPISPRKTIFKTNEKWPGLICISRNDFLKLKGYDEYYVMWGVEDDDFISRARVNGLRVYFYDKKLMIYHQWHPRQNISNHENMTNKLVYSHINRYNPVRNNNIEWGAILSKNQRPSLELVNEMQVDNVNVWNKADVSIFFIDMLNSSSKYSFVHFIPYKFLEYRNSLVCNIVSFFNLFLRFFNFNVLLDSTDSKSFLNTYEVYDIAVSLIQSNNDKILDYYISIQGDVVKMCLVKK